MALPFLVAQKKEDGGKKPGMFSPHAPPGPSSADLAEISSNVNNVSRRLRILEERYSSLRKKTQLTDQNILNSNKEIAKEIKTLNSELVEFRKSFDDLREKTRLIVRELKSCAKNEDVMMLQKYVNLWDPVKFATLNDVERIMNEKVEDSIEDMHLKIQEEKFIEEKVREEVKQALRELALNKRMNQ